jgi:pimeloyl-ACP methyl ester carboxylesterase
MPALAITDAPTDARTDRYRQAEQTLWSHYGLNPTERFVELESPAVRLRVVEIGSGPPVLFVPGTAGTGPVWAPLVRELTGFRCLMLDRPGWGLSLPLDYSQYEYKAVIADLLRGTLDALAIERTHVVGSSIGDAWALRLAERYPSRVDRVVLLGGGPLVPAITVPPFIRLLASPVGAVIVRLPVKAGRIRSIMRDSGHAASLEARRIPDAFVDWRVTLAQATDSMRHERDMVRTIVSGNTFRPGLTFTDSELAEIQQQTLLIYGTDDPVGTVDTWKRVVDLLPRAELRLVDGGGHLPWLDNPGAVADDISRFLAAESILD